MPRYDFLCERGHRFEADVVREMHNADCDYCGGPGTRLLAVPNTVTGDRPLTPRSQREVHMREYTEASQQLDYEFKREQDIRQTTLLEPPLWNQAKQAASAVLRGKRKPPPGWTPVSLT